MTTQAKSSDSMRSATFSRGLLDRDAESLLDQRTAQLAGHRLVALSDHSVDRLGKRQSRREAACHEGQRLRQLRVEGSEPLSVLSLEPPPREDDAADEREDHQSAALEDESDEGSTDGYRGVQQQPLRRLEGRPCAGQPLGEPVLEVSLDHLSGQPDGGVLEAALRLRAAPAAAPGRCGAASLLEVRGQPLVAQRRGRPATQGEGQHAREPESERQRAEQ